MSHPSASPHKKNPTKTKPLPLRTAPPLSIEPLLFTLSYTPDTQQKWPSLCSASTLPAASAARSRAARPCAWLPPRGEFCLFEINVLCRAGANYTSAAWAWTLILVSPPPLIKHNSVDRYSKNDIIVSPSILSADFARLGEEVRC